MKKRFTFFTFYLLVFIPLLFIYFSEDTFAAEKESYPVSGLTCYNEDYSLANELDYDEFRKYLEKQDIPYTVDVKPRLYAGSKVLHLPNKDEKVTLKVDKDLFFRRHIVVYNYRESDLAKTIGGQYQMNQRKVCGITGHRYLGFNEKGIAIIDPLSPPDVESYPVYFEQANFLIKPWDNQTVLNNIGTKPDPTLVYNRLSINSNTSSKKSQLKFGIDMPSFGFANKVGERTPHTNTRKYTMNDLRNRIDKKNTVMNVVMGDVLEKYAVIAMEREKYTPGLFYVYTHKSGGCYCYSAQFIVQEEDPTASPANVDFDASVVIKADEVYNKATDFNPKFVFKLKKDDESEEAKRIAETYCPAFPAKSENRVEKTLYCNSSDPTYQKPGIVIKDLDTNKTVFKLKNISPSKAGKLKFRLVTSQTDSEHHKPRVELSLNDILESLDKDFVIEEGNYSMKVWLPKYRDYNGYREDTYENNSHEVQFSVNDPLGGNAKLTLNMLAAYPAGVPLDSKFIIKNTFKQSIQGDLSVRIVDAKTKENAKGNGVTYEPFTIPYTIVASGKVNEYLKDRNIILDPGNYIIYGDITHHENESTYVDNSVKFKFTVDAFIPENTICDFVNTNYMLTSNKENLENVLEPIDGSADENKKGISRTCIGYTPKYPSTVVEGGQKTFFYVAYKAFAFPLPAYHIQNLDMYGVNQKLTSYEPNDALGSCTPEDDSSVFWARDYEQTFEEPYNALTNCIEDDTYYHFPSKFDASFTQFLSNADMKVSEDWLGPYKLGALDYYHYAYRGRLMPKSVTLDIKLFDTEENEINTSDRLGFGSMTFFLGDECYYIGSTDEPQLDIKDSCKLTQLYIPGNKTNFGDKNPKYFALPDDQKPFSVPEEKDKLEFLNVGLHALEINISEDHVYLYQKDLGSEFQGKDGIRNFDGYIPVDTTTFEKENGYWVQKPQIKFESTNATLNSKYDNPYMNHCYTTENATSTFGAWQRKAEPNPVFKEMPDDDKFHCLFDANSDYYYWMYHWSELKTLDSFYTFPFESSIDKPDYDGYGVVKYD